ncbi:Sec-independent protein translocase protein TatB [Bordetella sp. BOR01]|uniref:Sec-independent protein translocase protein TatB n=1 Tax=Bordetella sp. BOR01 TaxID=2854779 RepID=UPI001C450041|nr:Sec-independent protein translocase protein TatB [Bordetella sp. BOR01]MBV7484976.1 Sec-independent protein translocase protein TatB [Bordetella sp. BOR01]
MFDVSFTELMVIGVIALIVIGPERLPKVARTVGHLLGRAQRYVNDVKSDIQREIELDELRKFKNEMDDAANSMQSSMRDTESSLRSSLNDTAREATQAVSGSPAAEPAAEPPAAELPAAPAPAAADQAAPAPDTAPADPVPAAQPKTGTTP